MAGGKTLNKWMFCRPCLQVWQRCQMCLGTAYKIPRLTTFAEAQYQ